jgi:hypothetical protein
MKITFDDCIDTAIQMRVHEGFRKAEKYFFASSFDKTEATKTARNSGEDQTVISFINRIGVFY